MAHVGEEFHLLLVEFLFPDALTLQLFHTEALFLTTHRQPIGINQACGYEQGIDQECPSRQVERRIHLDLQRADLLGDTPVTAYDAHFERIGSGREIGKRHLVAVRRCHHPFVRQPFQPIVEALARRHHNRRGSQLYGKRIIIRAEFYLAGDIEGFFQYHMSVILLSHRQRMVKENQAAEDDFRLCLNRFLAAFGEYVHTILSAKEHVALAVREDGTEVELPSLQSVEMVVVHDGEITTLALARDCHLCHAFIRGNPDVSMMVFSNATGHLSAQSVVYGQFVQVIIQLVKNIKT